MSAGQDPGSHAEHCAETRGSVLFISAVGGFNAVVEPSYSSVFNSN